MGESGVGNGPGSLSRLCGLAVEAAVTLGRAEVLLRDLAVLGAGSVIQLDRLVNDPVDLKIGGRTVARAEMVVIGEDLGLRITELASPSPQPSARRRPASRP